MSGAGNLQLLLHLLANTEDFALPYYELSKYTQFRNGNVIIGVIPECVDDVYLGKSDRTFNALNIVSSLVYNGSKVSFI